MAKFKFNGRLITASTKQQAIHKIVSSINDEVSPDYYSRLGSELERQLSGASGKSRGGNGATVVVWEHEEDNPDWHEDGSNVVYWGHVMVGFVVSKESVDVKKFRGYAFNTFQDKKFGTNASVYDAYEGYVSSNSEVGVGFKVIVDDYNVSISKTASDIISGVRKAADTILAACR